MNGIKENQGKFLKIETVMCQVENTLDKTAVRWGGGAGNSGEDSSGNPPRQRGGESRS